MSVLITLLVARFPFLSGVLVSVATLLLAARALIRVSPTKVDDAWLAKIMAIPVIGKVIRALIAYSPIKDPEQPN